MKKYKIYEYIYYKLIHITEYEKLKLYFKSEKLLLRHQSIHNNILLQTKEQGRLFFEYSSKVQSPVMIPPGGWLWFSLLQTIQLHTKTIHDHLHLQFL